MLKEFKEFALKGNMVDMAIGIIIGAAFTGLVNSIVNDMLMPVIGLFTGGINFSNMFIQLTGVKQATLASAREAGATIAYGNFITLVINFIIVAWVLFLLVKLINRLRSLEKKQPETKVVPRDEQLLTEIRDLLAAKPTRSTKAATAKK